LENQCARAIVGRAGTILLVGDAGTGKSTLARHAATTSVPPGASVLEIDAASDESLFRGLVRALHTYGVRGMASLPEATLRFMDRRREPNPPARPAVCLLPDITDEQMLRALGPPGHRSTVLVTSTNAILGTSVSATIHVGSMTSDEATSMVTARLPRL